MHGIISEGASAEACRGVCKEAPSHQLLAPHLPHLLWAPHLNSLAPHQKICAIRKGETISSVTSKHLKYLNLEGGKLKKLHVPRSGASFYNVQCICSEIVLLVMPRLPITKAAICVPRSDMLFLNVQCICVTKIPLFANWLLTFFIAPHLFFLAPHLIWKIGVAPRKIGVAPENFSRAPRAAPHLKKILCTPLSAGNEWFG